MIPLHDELSRLALGEPRHFRNLTLFPVLRSATAAEPDYLLADHAIAQGLARVTELGGGGSVPELRFENNAAMPVLLVDGEELIGAKQNRVLNLTILAPPQTAIVIPVSCVEAGRWHMNTPEFQLAPHMMYSEGRASRVRHVTESMRVSGSRRSDQSAVWDGIAAKAERMQAHSPTQAMSALYECHAASVEEYVRALSIDEPHAGIVFAIGGGSFGLDLFDHPATMRWFFPKLLRSYALDAVDGPAPQSEPATAPAAREFLNQVSSASISAQPAVGLGKDLRITSPTVSGAALWANGRYLHVCAFPSQGTSEAPTRMTRPSRRRR